jgi:hypothetical protein
MKRIYRYYAPEEVQWVKDNCRGLFMPEAWRLFNARFGTEITLMQFKGILFNNKIRLGTRGKVLALPAGISGYLSNEFFVYFCTQYAQSRNAEFKNPLPSSEVISIGKSVGKWVSRHMSADGFKKWRENRAKKSLEVRQATAEKRNAEIIAYKIKNPETSYRKLANIFNVSLKTIDRIQALKELERVQICH